MTTILDAGGRPMTKTPPMTAPVEAQMPAIAHVPVVVDPARAFMPVPLSIIDEAAMILAGMPGLAKELATMENCRAIAYQAARWGLDPVYVASKAYFANGRIGYEAQLVHALVLANAPLRRRPRFQYGYSMPDKPLAMYRFCRVELWLVGENEPVYVTSPTVAQIGVKNSPLWKSDPDQQLSYYTIRSAARRHCPEVLAGIYVPEELQQIRELDAKPEPMFEEDEPIDAVFDTIPPTAEHEANFTRWSDKAEGKQDSRDPRDAPANMEAPPQGSVEPEDMPDIRAWAGSTQAEIMALTIRQQAETTWKRAVDDKRWGRLKAYDSEIAKKIHAGVTAHIKGLT